MILSVIWQGLSVLQTASLLGGTVNRVRTVPTQGKRAKKNLQYPEAQQEGVHNCF